MRIDRLFLRMLVLSGTNILCRVERAPFKQVPRQGPLILAINHIGSLEIPLLVAHLLPRRMTGLVKIETWNNRFMGWLFDAFEAIPIRRGEADLEAFRRSLAVLAAGKILIVSPEGTRSWNGRLLRAQPGIVTLALRSGAPILPLVHWGGENFGANLKHLKRTDFHVRVGKPFKIEAGGEKVTGQVRQKIADEIMCQLAALMPEKYRGEYVNCESLMPAHIRYS